MTSDVRACRSNLSGHVSSSAKGCGRQAMQQGREDCNDAVVYELAGNHSRLLKVVGSVQGCALGLVLCQPLPVSQLEDKLEQGEGGPLHSRQASWQAQGVVCSDMLCSHQGNFHNEWVQKLAVRIRQHKNDTGEEL